MSRLPCGHLFHEDCLKAWITKHCTCPVCRYELPSTSTDFNAGRSARMASRKPRYHKYELERMSGGELMRLARELGVVSTSSSAGVSDKVRSSDLRKGLRILSGLSFSHLTPPCSG